MHLISLSSLEVEKIESMIDAGIRIKQAPHQYEDLLKGKSLYMLFQKTSTRTALGFGLGFNELGGRYFIQRWEDSNFAVGEIIDETRYVARNVDMILARLKNHVDVETMGRCSPVPVINGCCDKYHPTQALTDCMTIKEFFGTYQKTLVYIGIWNNTFNSLAASFPRLGGRLIGVCPILNEATITEKDAKKVVKNNENLEWHRSIGFGKLKNLVDQADIVYTDTWIDMEFINNPDFKRLGEKRVERMMPYQITAELLKDSHAMVMHDMPIHPGYEIDRETVETHIDVILDQGENRKHVAKGIFAHLLEFQI